MTRASSSLHNSSFASSKWIERIARAPSRVPTDIARYYVYWRIFYFLAATTHVLALLFFLDHEIWFMVGFNVYSVSAFTCCLFLLRQGNYRVAYWIAITELLGHAVAATVCVGVEYGALDATMLILVLVFVQPFYSMRFSLLLAGLVLTIATATQHYALTHGAVYTQFQVSLVDYAFRIITWPLLVLAMVIPFIRAAARAEREVQSAHAESERLLLNILPEPVANRLKASDDIIADEHNRVAILFVDIVGFTEMTKGLPAGQVVQLLNDFFFAVDDLIGKHGAEKIKTIGDAYLIAVGAPAPVPDPESRAAALALDILDCAKRLRRPDTGEALTIRIGAHSGKVVAGVIGKKKFAYDIWGDTVNLAARMESSGRAGRIQVSETFADHLDTRFQLEPRGKIEAKGHGQVKTYYLSA